MQQQDYVGKIIFIQEPMRTPVARNIEPFGYRVTGTRSTRQLTLAPMEQACRERNFTRLGDHIAVVVSSEQQYAQAKAVLLGLREAVSKLDTEATGALKLISNSH